MSRDERKKIKVTINGSIYEPIVTLDDNLDIMGLFFYTAEERGAIKEGLIRVADIELASRLDKLLRGEKDALTSELEQNGKTLSEEEFSRQLNDRLHQRIGESAIARISFDKQIRYDLAARMVEIFSGDDGEGEVPRGIWCGDAKKLRAGIRITPSNVTDFVLAVFTAFPPQEQLEDALEAKGLIEVPTNTESNPSPQKNEVAELVDEIREDLEVENHMPQASQAAEAIIMGDEKAADAATLVELSDQKTLSERLRAAGVGDDVIARVIGVEAEAGAMG